MRYPPGLPLPSFVSQASIISTASTMIESIPAIAQPTEQSQVWKPAH